MTAVEYALMVAIIALLLVGGFYALFNAIKAKPITTSEPALPASPAPDVTARLRPVLDP